MQTSNSIKYLTDLVKPSIKQLEAYKTAKSVEVIKNQYQLDDVILLASNENPLPPSEKIKTALLDNFDQLRRYPDPAVSILSDAISKKLQISKNELLLANGSAEALALFIGTFCDLDSEVIISQYAYAFFENQIKLYGAKPVIVPAKDYSCNSASMINAVNSKTRMIIIANPNNPTGTYLSHNILEELLKSIPPNVLMIVDEAYCDYVDYPDYPNTLQLRKNYSNMIIVRSFSKAYSLAGLRLGYAIAHSSIIELLQRVRLSFNVNQLAQIAGCIALEDTATLKMSLSLINEEKKKILKMMEENGIFYLPAAANFITFKPTKKASDVFVSLLKQGILIRDLNNYGLPDYLRVSIGTPDENDKFLSALTTALIG